MRLIASTNAIFGRRGVHDAAHQPRRHVTARQGPRQPVPDQLHRRQDSRRHRAARRARRMGREKQRRRLAQKGLAPMAALDPRGCDGPSPREFTAVRHFMMADLGLSGLPLLVYARIFGFCDAGSTTSRARAAWPGSSTCRSGAPTAPSATCSTGASSRNAACTPRRAGTPRSATASCARGCRPARWRTLTNRQDSLQERVTRCQGSPRTRVTNRQGQQPVPLTRWQGNP